MTLVQNINPIEFVEMTKNSNDVVVIDCRTKAEIEQQCLDFQIHIDLYDTSTHQILNELDVKKKYIIYCRSGARSQYLGEYLAQNGFNNIFNLDGGILNWNYYKRSNLI